MKIACSVQSESLEAPVESRFGRAKYFVIYDTDTDQYEIISNETNFLAPKGAGVQTAQNLINKGVKVVITGNCGPKATQILETAGVKIITGVEGLSAKEAIQKYRNAN